MNEFVTDLEMPVKSAGKWIAAKADAIGNACHDAGGEVDSGIRKGRRFYQSVQYRVGKKAEAANAAVHVHPYPVVLIGIGAGFALGYLFSILIHTAGNREE